MMGPSNEPSEQRWLSTNETSNHANAESASHTQAVVCPKTAVKTSEIFGKIARVQKRTHYMIVDSTQKDVCPSVLTATAVCRRLASSPQQRPQQHVDVSDDASASSVRHHIGEPYAREDQYTCESRGNGVHSHAMPIFIVIAFRAFIFCEVRDG